MKKYSYCAKIIILIAIFFFQSRPFCFADKIHLKNGSVIEGKVIKEDEDMFLIEVEDGTIAFHKNEITSVEKKASGDEDRDTADKAIYKVIDTEKSETPLKIMLTSSIVVHANVNGDILKHILEKATREVAAPLSNYKQPVKQSVIYAYLSEETYKINKSAWVGKAFWIIGTDEIRIDINNDKLESAYQEASLNQEIDVQIGKDYPGVFGPDGNYRTKSILPFEKQVHAALKREFDLNPEPNRRNFTSSNDWMRACELIENKCIAKIAEQFNLDEKTVTAIWYKVEDLKH